MPLNRDALLLYAAAFLRSACAGLTGVAAAIVLKERSLSVSQAGYVIGAGLAGAAIATAAVSAWADALGRRRTLALLAVMTTAGYVTLATSHHFILLLCLSCLGMVNAMGRDRGAAAALEQAILPQTTVPARRTWTFAWYNVVLDAGQTAGSAAAALPILLAGAWGVRVAAAHAWAFAACGMAVFATTAAYAALSPRIEAAAVPEPPQVAMLATATVLRRLVLLFGLDSLGSGFLNSALLAYWFFERYAMSEAHVALLFAAARLLNALSHLLAAWLSRRIGLLNTMVATHLPSSLLLMSAPLAPTAAGASALFLAREALVEMDVPTRQSYMMAIVPPDRRTLVSGVTNVTRLIGWATGPLIAGLMMQGVASASPLIVGGSLKILYDVLLYRAFHAVKAPEEQVRGTDDG